MVAGDDTKGTEMQANKKWFGVMLAALPLAGCAIDDGANDEPTTDQTQQKASWGEFYDWSREANLPTSADSTNIGSTSDRSCFLAGVAGNIESVYGASEGANTLYSIALAGVDSENGHFILQAETGGGYEKLHARAMCLNDVSGRSSVFTYDSDYDTSATKMAADDGSHVCFLRQIVNTQFYYNDNDFSSASDEIHIFSIGGYWYLGGVGNVHAEAQCIKVQEDLGEWNWTNGTVNIAQNDLEPGTQCFLTGYKGTLRDDDYSDGAFISYESGLLQYQLSVSAGKRAWARCVK
jgi:hypothetical protein